MAGPQINPRGASYYPAPSVPTPFGQGPGAPVWQLTNDLNSPWLARAAVREHSHYGTDWIKIYETEAEFVGRALQANEWVKAA